MIHENEYTFSADDRQEVLDAVKEIMLTELGGLYQRSYYVPERGDEDLEKILAAAKTLAGGPEISVNTMAKALELLIDSGELQPKDFMQSTPLEEPEEDTRPRDKNGKVLTEAQIAWSEYRQYAETHSVDDCRRRARTDAGFGNFVRKNLEREMTQPIGDAVVPVGDRGTQLEPNGELAEFARKYNVEPVSNLRPKGGFVTLAGEQMPYQKFLDLVNKASAIKFI